MEYKVISTYDKEDFEVAISAYLRHGWTLVGGVNVVTIDGQLFYSQAIALIETVSIRAWDQMATTAVQ